MEREDWKLQLSKSFFGGGGFFKEWTVHLWLAALCPVNSIRRFSARSAATLFGPPYRSVAVEVSENPNVAVSNALARSIDVNGT